MSKDFRHKPATSTAEIPAQDAAHENRTVRPVKERAGGTRNSNAAPGHGRSPVPVAKRRQKRRRKRHSGDRWLEAFGAGACEFVSLMLDMAQADEPSDWHALSEEDKLNFSYKCKAP